MGVTRACWILAGALLLGCVTAFAADAPQSESRKWTFEDTTAGVLPKDWKVEATKQDGPLATWEVTEDKSGKDPVKALTLTKPNHTSGSTFNLCWTNTAQMKDVSLKLRFKANTGADDQGGGPIWRVQDKDNYYVCRANPLEDNFRLYYVKAGKRIQLANADLKIPTGQWHVIEVEHAGSHIVCSLDGKKVLEADDSTLPNAGGVGVWTKADAATSFDDIEVRPAASLKR